MITLGETVYHAQREDCTVRCILVTEDNFDSVAFQLSVAGTSTHRAYENAVLELVGYVEQEIEADKAKIRAIEYRIQDFQFKLVNLKKQLGK